VTERMAADSKNTDFSIGPTLLFDMSAVFWEDMLRQHFSWTGSFASCSAEPPRLPFWGKVNRTCAPRI
jgi:hypothetical protein